MPNPAGQPQRTPTPHALQAVPTRDARESVIAVLTRHFAEDRLSLEEFERRAELAYAAATTADLDALTADMAIEAPEEVPSRIVAVFSNQERSGPATVPRQQRVSCLFGNVELDLRQATFVQGVSEMEISAVFGNVEIILPPHIRVEVIGGAFLGSFGASGANTPRDAPIVLRVSGRAVFGNVEIRQGRAGAPPAFLPPRE
jgi:hypothetical protein